VRDGSDILFGSFGGNAAVTPKKIQRTARPE